MKHYVRKVTTLVLSFALTLSLAVGISAMMSDYRLHVTADKQIQFLRDDQIKGRYYAYATNLTIKKNDKGSLTVNYQGANRAAKSVSLGSQDTLQISGEINSLTIDKSVDDQVDIVFSGGVETLVVNGSPYLSISGGADVAVLKVGNAKAQVMVEKKTLVKETYAVDKKAVTGVSKVYGMSEANASVTSNEKIVNEQGKIETVLLIEERDKDTRNAKEYTIDGEYEVSFVAKNGMSLGAVMRDLQLSVERVDTGNKVGGSWNWIVGDYNTTTSGVYQYQFKPSLSQYGTITLKVNFTGNGNSRSMDKPGLSFSDGQSSHGAPGIVDITVSFPKQIEDDDKLIVIVNNVEVDEEYLSESDASGSQSYSVPVSGDKNDKVKIKVRIKRAVGGGTITSSTINFTID